ncbi:hypothetical protein SAMN05421823_11962 [Catalinimonas alkaloidigena]|uniref:Uncharacterized protein n=1 Tax=Catalinimonas alkaloidigena TaxID=1075417 RepID=A0A1G9VA07_9BACT|nr:hypothetical protein [Catalinimonas alkaloidigena]SDM68897.1 hypothetical protein SAMN05421823_11962 [Catalinimonas alkaloidigena]
MGKILQLDGHPCELRLLVTSPYKGKVTVIGFDQDDLQSIYFRRTVPLDEPVETLIFPLPLAPQRLGITFDEATTRPTIEKVEQSDLIHEQAGWDEELQDLVDFAQWIVRRLHRLSASRPDRLYTSRQGRHLLNLFADRIIDREGKALATPARVSRLTGVIEASRKMMAPYTLPMRLFVLLHEYMHYRLKTTDETQADLGALRVFMALGYSATEAMYATVKVLPDVERNRERVDAIMTYLYEYDEKYRKPFYEHL